MSPPPVPLCRTSARKEKYKVIHTANTGLKRKRTKKKTAATMDAHGAEIPRTEHTRHREHREEKKADLSV
jgi:hypothetical protein